MRGHIATGHTNTICVEQVEGRVYTNIVMGDIIDFLAHYFSAS